MTSPDPSGSANGGQESQPSVDRLQLIQQLLEHLRRWLSHDVNSLFVTIRGMSHLLLESDGDRLSDEGRDYLGRILRAVDRGERQVRDLLDLERVCSRAGVPERISFAEAVREAASRALRLFPDCPLEYDVRGEAAYLRIPPAAFDQVLQWIFRQAIRGRRPNHGLHVTFEAAQQDGFWMVRAIDNGSPPIPDRIARAFDPQGIAARGEGSEGIELFSIRHAVESWGGTVFLAASEDGGAELRLTLPA